MQSITEVKSKLPLAKEFLEDNLLKNHHVMDSVEPDEVEEVMIAFAKMHRKLALEAASNTQTPHGAYDFITYDERIYEDKATILNAYSETNIK